jgi:hypothetical protein
MDTSLVTNVYQQDTFKALDALLGAQAAALSASVPLTGLTDAPSITLRTSLLDNMNCAVQQSNQLLNSMFPAPFDTTNATYVAIKALIVTAQGTVPQMARPVRSYV